MLQEVEIIPTLVYLHHKGCLAVFFCPKGLFGLIFKGLPCVDPILAFNLGPIFGWEMDGIWARVLHRSCSFICELDVRILNHPNRTFTTQVMVHFPGLPQLRLFICLCPNLGTSFQLGNKGNLDSCSS